MTSKTKKTLTFIILISQIIISSSTHDSFANECGPYTGEVEDNPESTDCIGQSTGSTTTCCYVEGEKDLAIKTACIAITNTQEERINAVKELNTIATGVKIDCGTQKSFPSDCGDNNPSSKGDCNKDVLTDGYDCCFISIKSEQFTGNGCKKYKSLDINTIGEAVVAAKTVGAILEVDCFGKWINHFIYSIFILIFLF